MIRLYCLGDTIERRDIEHRKAAVSDLPYFVRHVLAIDKDTLTF